jgi:hypothetical protein
MAEQPPPQTGVADERRQRARLGLAVRLPGLLILGVVLVYFGIRSIARGEDETMWVLVLVAYTLGSAVAVWLMRRGIREAGD